MPQEQPPVSNHSEGAATEIFVTKYALTKGIYRKMAVVTPTDSIGPMARVVDNAYGEYYHRDEFHTTEAAALLKAEDMRLKAVALLARKMAKLNKLEFKIK